MSMVKAATVVGWHRHAFRLFWYWKIRRGKAGRPSVPGGVRELIRTTSREPAVGSATHSRRIAQTGHRHRPDQRRQIYGQAPKTAVADVEDISGESSQDAGVGRLLHGANDPVPGLVRFSGAGTRTPAYRALRSDVASDSGVDGAADARSVSVGYRTTVSAAGSRPDLWPGVRGPGKGNGHQTSAVGAAVAVATRMWNA